MLSTTCQLGLNSIIREFSFGVVLALALFRMTIQVNSAMVSHAFYPIISALRS